MGCTLSTTSERSPCMPGSTMDLANGKLEMEIDKTCREMSISPESVHVMVVELTIAAANNAHAVKLVTWTHMTPDTTTVTDSMPTQNALAQEPGSMAHYLTPVSLSLTTIPCALPSTWILGTMSLVPGLVTTGALFVGRCPISFPFLEMLHPSHALVPCLGIVMAATVDGLSRSKGMILSPTYAYSWDYVLITTILFDAFYAYAAFKEKLRGWRLTLQLTKAVCVGTAQTLFFLKKFGVFHGSWLVVAAPVAVWTVLLALQCQWQTLVGVTAIAAACKVSIDTSNLVSPADLAASAGHGVGYLWFLIVWAVPIMYYLAILSRD
ncbi:hypothetical protein DYB35_007082 [Aphanomyces astaci]|uniref:Uncharacterized protein n=1 Tax=Aphanomyces astaci TaxID=112090 RepID=A0A418DRF3_APHAT|nr:hypothetical protein DYB35_007082 [Aphanomyces astaci]